MSKVQLQGNVSGTGVFTIAAPNSNVDRTINLPDATGTVQVSGNPISGTTGTFTGLLNISAAGAGQIQFPATQNASSNANILDDYEEGTFTPSVASADGTQPTVTYTSRSGIYVKVGQLVHFSLHIAISTTSGGTGTLMFSGLPFTATVPVGQAGYQAVSVGYTASWTAAPYVPYNALVFQGSTNIRTYWTAVLGGNKVDNTVSQITNGLEIYLAGSYRCDA